MPKHEPPYQTGVGGVDVGRYIKTYDSGGTNFIHAKETAPVIDRSRPWPIDEFAFEQQRRRDQFMRELRIGIVLGIVAAYPPVYLVLMLTGHVR